MDLRFSPEQDELRATTRRFLERNASEARLRELMSDPLGQDPVLWARLAGELGVVGVAVPEDHGGSGYGAVELGIVLEEFGRQLVCAPFFSTVVLAGSLLTLLDDPACGEHLSAIADGSLLATVAMPARSQVVARAHGAGWLLSGAATHVLDGALVRARPDRGRDQ